MAFYFFEPRPTINMEGLVRTWGVALGLVDTLMELDRRINYISYWPAMSERTATLTAIIILRIVRSSIAHHFDVERGERAFFSIVGAFKKASLQPGDLRTRACAILSQLWADQDVFRYPDGHIDSLRTRIRSRLSMSLVFDCFLWYKDSALDKFERPPSTQESAVGSEAGGLPAAPRAPLALSHPQIQAAGQPLASSAAAAPSTSPHAVGDVAADAVLPAVPLSMALQDERVALDSAVPQPAHLGGDLWMVPDYDWAASFQLSADSLPQVPWMSGQIGGQMGF